MSELNDPRNDYTVECPHCKGFGKVVIDDFPFNCYVCSSYGYVNEMQVKAYYSEEKDVREENGD